MGFIPVNKPAKRGFFHAFTLLTIPYNFHNLYPIPV